ncbi:hypothetical protein PACTADRAFT_51405 [Pachysolen tannophilus NRRL Y-2460]|uniref:L-type lectin-like domain-containing protein n=1 Tax=Pachysolen tannophilus NRRL Y-2460 TaxID=669874 RepID=A0A1E4TPI3_PACTA|nr:hypothetical protein PACTADRAFT_51405 [Pachysolen tannophilus NRRL Y-2460]
MRIIGLPIVSCFLVVVSLIFLQSPFAFAESPDSKYLVDESSLINLSQLKDITELKNYNWDFSDATKFDNGRFVLTPKTDFYLSNSEEDEIIGGIWNRDPVSLSNGFTFETTLRSIGNAGGDTGAGLSIWFVQKHDNSKVNYGGPAIYDGLQILIASNSVRSFLNDGSKPVDLSTPFSTCYSPFQKSEVPTTFRLSYEQGWFKLSIDNRLCFHTEVIKFEDLSKFKIGITAKSNKIATKHEQFELLKFETYNRVTEEAKLEDKGILVSQPKVVTKIVEDLGAGAKPTETAAKYQDFSSRQQRLRESVKKTPSSTYNTGEILDKLSLVEGSNADLLSKIENLQTILLSSVGSDKGKGSNFDKETLIQSADQYQNLVKSVNGNSDHLKELTMKVLETSQMIDNIDRMVNAKFIEVEKLINSNVAKKLESIESRVIRNSNDLYDKIIYKLGELELSQQSTNQLSVSGSKAIASLNSRIRWIIITVILVIAALSMFLYRLRNDVKHGKII